MLLLPVLTAALALSSKAAPTTGNFSVLTYNVAGLPELLSSGDPAVNTPLISPRLAPYRFINVQEDFNYHAALYAGDNHAFRTPTSGTSRIGSGLNSLSDFSFINLERVKWSACNLNSGDCLTPKGYTLVRVKVSDGVWVDVYNLHTDAGSDDGDRNARTSNFAQLTAAINYWSPGFPVVVMGDTNARYTSLVDADSLRNFISAVGVTDLWISNIRGGAFPVKGSAALTCPFPFPSGTSQTTMVACEVVDKIFIRSSPAVTLSATAFVNANNVFVNASNYPLSDHYPISGSISWRLSSSIRLADVIGGPHGDPFNGISTVLSGTLPKLATLTIRGGERIDQVGYTVLYPDGTTRAVSHGGTGGTASTLTLGSGERITEITACQGEKDGRTRVFSLSFRTNLGRSLSAGVTTSSCLTSTVPTDVGTGGAWGIVSFWGRSGTEVDTLGGIWGAVY